MSQSDNIHAHQKNEPLHESTTSTLPASAIFSDRRVNYMNEFNLYLAQFNTLPNFIEEININCKKANEWFLVNYKKEIKDSFYSRVYPFGKKTPEYDDIFYILYADLLVYFESNDDSVKFLFRKTDIGKIETLISELRKFKQKKQRTKPRMALLINSEQGIDTKMMYISRPKMRIEENYNDDFHDVHKTILKRLSKKNDKGLVLLHGKPGTGKTSYIRYLIARVKKEVIFLPPNMASAITNPNLISVLIDNPNSIFVIEDAENIVVDRDQDGVSPVSSLLNLSDGLLSDCLNIQIICSFNTDLSKIDSALMRKGRLIARYEFKELAVEKANNLFRKLGSDASTKVPMTLAAIYNQSDADYQQQPKNKMGF